MCTVALLATWLPDPSVDTAAVGLVVAALLLTGLAALAGRPAVVPQAATPVMATGDERCLRGSFRPQSNPAAPGRPRPRAPGSGQ